MGLIDWSPGLEWIDDQMNKGGDGKSIKLTPDKEQWQLDAGKAIGDVLQKYLPGYEPGKEYTGQRTAGMTPAEQQSMALLMKYMSSPSAGELSKLGGEQLTKTLQGGYDPRTSPQYEGMRQEMNLMKERDIDAARRAGAARGSYNASGSLREENDVRSSYGASINRILGDLYGQERQRMFEAAPMAQNYEQGLQGQALQQIQAGQQFGAIPRLIEQSDMEAKYQDFLRKQGEYGNVPGMGQNLLNSSINYGMKEIPMPREPSAFERIFSAAAPIAGTVIGGAVGGTPGAMIGGSLGSAAGGAMSGGGSSSPFGNYNMSSSSFYPAKNNDYLN